MVTAPTRLSTSVAMCTYNGAAYLGAQLDSLLAQARLPDEIVVRDDVSTDGTWAQLLHFRGRAEASGITVRLVQNERNLGYVANFSAALSDCSGDILFLCDQDDVWYPGKIRSMAAAFEADPALLMLASDADLIDAAGNDLGLRAFDALEMTVAERAAMVSGDAFDVLVRRNIVTGAAAAIRSTLLPMAFPFPDDWVHDEWLAMTASIHGRVRVVDAALVGYRQHGANQIGMRRRTRRERLLGARIARRAYFRQIAARLEILLARTAIPSARRVVLEDRLAHARVRAAVIGPMALGSVLAEVRTGRYHAFSSGWRSVVSDLAGLQ